VHRAESGGNAPGNRMLGVWQPRSLAALSFAHQKHLAHDGVGMLEKCCGADLDVPPFPECGLFGIVDGIGGLPVASELDEPICAARAREWMYCVRRGGRAP
jgi:hypothetical protein